MLLDDLFCKYTESKTYAVTEVEVKIMLTEIRIMEVISYIKA